MLPGRYLTSSAHLPIISPQLMVVEVTRSSRPADRLNDRNGTESTAYSNKAISSTTLDASETSNKC